MITPSKYSIVLLGYLLNSYGLLSAFPTQDEESPGSEALAFQKRANFITRFDAAYYEGKVTTSPPNAIRLDRRAESLIKIGSDMVFGGKIGLRIIAKIHGAFRLEEETEEPKTFIDETLVRAYPTAALTYIHTTGMELFAGGTYNVFPEYTRTRIDPNGTTTWEYETVSLPAPYFGLVKRSSGWSGGIYYSTSAEVDRNYVRTAFGEEIDEGLEPVFTPITFGIVGSAFVRQWQVEGELAVIQAGDIGPKDQDGDHLYEDHFRARMGVVYPYSPGLSVRFAAIHQTLSYANQGAVLLDNIAATSYRLQFLIGNAKSHSYLGILYGSGRDAQSFDEFNANYEYRAYGASFGLFYPL